MAATISDLISVTLPSVIAAATVGRFGDQISVALGSIAQLVVQAWNGQPVLIDVMMDRRIFRVVGEIRIIQIEPDKRLFRADASDLVEVIQPDRRVFEVA